MVFFFGGLYTFRAKSWPYFFSESTISRKRYCYFFANSANFSKVQIPSKYYGIIYLLTLLFFKFYPSYGSIAEIFKFHQSHGSIFLSESPNSIKIWSYFWGNLQILANIVVLFYGESPNSSKCCSLIFGGISKFKQML